MLNVETTAKIMLKKLEENYTVRCQFRQKVTDELHKKEKSV